MDNSELPKRPPSSLLRPLHELHCLLQQRHGLLLLLAGVLLGVSFVVRCSLLLQARSEVAWSGGLLSAFALGLVFDLATAALCLSPLALLLALLPRTTFTKRAPRFVARVFLFAFCALVIFGGMSEWLFWDEFGVRFNFIAVDYLVYTTEVLGNIRESYSLPRIFATVFAASAVLTAVLEYSGLLPAWLNNAASSAKARWKAASLWVAAALVVGLFLEQRQLPDFSNNYNKELAKNGLWSFVSAFRDNELDFERFYPTMPQDEAFKRVQTLIGRDGSRRLNDNPRDLLRQVPAPRPGPEQRLNVIQITVESLSAEFLTRYGNTRGLTPHLDALASKSLVFDNFYATGTRTDRGMEALTLSVPPTAGRSLVKRPNNEHLFTLGSVFRQKGYNTAFIYGGYGYFDNMNHFFGENGYRVVDRSAVDGKDITFANAWGACDEDLFRWVLREADADHAAGKNFFHFVMTTSNHRPYTYPDGSIDLPSKVSGRSGGVKYTDHAINALLRAAADKPWFKNTVFVIVADHCASSAGKSELPVSRYHVPLFIYAPGGQIAPGSVDTLMSQVDYAPTLLGLLNWSYPSRFFGWNVLAENAPDRGRAFIGTYQQLGLYSKDLLGVLKPVKRSSWFNYDHATNVQKPARRDEALWQDLVANYQVASWLFKHQAQREVSPEDDHHERFARH